MTYWFILNEHKSMKTLIKAINWKKNKNWKKKFFRMFFFPYYRHLVAAVLATLALAEHEMFVLGFAELIVIFSM